MVESNPFLDDDEDETPQGGSENVNFKQLRDYSKKLERDLKNQTKEIERLAVFETQAREATLRNAGLSDKHAALFVRVNPDAAVTPELVQAFVQEYEIPVSRGTETPDTIVEDTPEQTPAVVPGQIIELSPETPAPTGGFAPTPPAGTASGSYITEVSEAEKLMVSNPQEFARLYQAGRVKLEKLPGAGSSNLPGAS